MTQEQSITLIHRLNRIQGQIEALKRSIEKEEQNCLENIQQVKAVHAAIKRFGEAYVRSYAQLCGEREGTSKRFNEQIDTLITSAFTI